MENTYCDIEFNFEGNHGNHGSHGRRVPSRVGFNNKSKQ
jgi:hypothetical protein